MDVWHLKNVTAEELSKEISIVRQRFKTSGLKREEFAMIILSYPQLFEHLLNMNLV